MVVTILDLKLINVSCILLGALELTAFEVNTAALIDMSRNQLKFAAFPLGETYQFTWSEISWIAVCQPLRYLCDIYVKELSPTLVFKKLKVIVLELAGLFVHFSCFKITEIQPRTCIGISVKVVKVVCFFKKATCLCNAIKQLKIHTRNGVRFAWSTSQYFI